MAGDLPAPKSARPQENRAILVAFLAFDVTPWAFGLEDAEQAGGAVLITANSWEFARVPGPR
jgi:hypothetical protein